VAVKLGPPPDDLIAACAATAERLGWEVRWVDSDGDRKIVVTDPAEPAPLNRVEYPVGNGLGWAPAAADAGLITEVRVDDIVDAERLRLWIAEEKHILLRMRSGMYYSGQPLRIEKERRERRLDLFGAFHTLDPLSGNAGPVVDTTIDMTAIRECAFLEPTSCECYRTLWFGPDEDGDLCPECGDYVSNKNLTANPLECDSCGAIRPCKCDVLAKAAVGGKTDKYTDDFDRMMGYVKKYTGAIEAAGEAAKLTEQHFVIHDDYLKMKLELDELRWKG
jgi:hypothetical protein